MRGARRGVLARRKPLGAVSAVIILGLVVVAILAPVLAPRDPYQFNLNERGLPIRMQAPTAAFPLGTDPLGRDVLSRIVYGARVSLVVGFASVIIGTLLGTGPRAGVRLLGGDAGSGDPARRRYHHGDSRASCWPWR